jgi:CheY-like chemotaxis protein
VPCEKCAEPVEASPRTLELLGLEPEEVEHAELRMGPGCGFCAQTGDKGRLGLFEVVRVTRTMRELIVARASETAMRVDGYEVLAASEVAEGLRMVDSERPDVVVLNLDLPGVDVVELLASLRSGTGGEPAVLVAADPEERHARDRALAAGAAGFIAKPLVEAELRAEVAAALERRPALTTAHQLP